MKVPTINHIKKAIKIAHAGGKWYKFWGLKVRYEQSNWCGTSCCVWGHAMLLAGNEKILNSSKFNPHQITLEARNDFAEIDDQHRALSRMMSCPSEEVLPVLSDLVKKNSPVKKILLRAKKSTHVEVKFKATFALDTLERREDRRTNDGS